MRNRAGLLLSAVLALPLATFAQDKKDGSKEEKFSCPIIYVPTDQKIVDRMLEMAKVKKDDVVFDLGCGDGRIVCTAAKRYGAKGVGVDIDIERIKDCKKTMQKLGVTADQVDIRLGDALKVKDLERATVVMLYMLPEFMAKLEPQLKRLKPGTRIVAHEFRFPNAKPDHVVEFQLTPTERRLLYLWTIPEKK